MTNTTGAAELPEALAHAEGLDSFAGQLPAYGFNPQPLKDAATHLRRQHALLNEQQRTIEALNACINGEGSTTTENLRRVDRLHAAHQHAQGNVALLADILNRRPAMNAVLAEAYGAWTAEVYDLMGTMAAAPANDAQVEALRAQPAGAAFDAHGFREWVQRNMPDDTIIGSSAWWADHLTQWAQRFVKVSSQPAGALPSGDELRKIARSARTSASDDASPTEYILAGWRAAKAQPAGAATPTAINRIPLLEELDPTAELVMTGYGLWELQRRGCPSDT